MSSLYKKKNTWYLSVQVNGKRTSKSLKTSSKNVAVLLKDKAEYELITELFIPNTILLNKMFFIVGFLRITNPNQ